MSLSESERLIVQKTWGDASRAFGGTSYFGLATFNLLFDRHPEYIQLFRAFQGIPPSELKTSPSLRAQATNVFAALNVVFENLDDSEFQSLMHKKLGNDHIERKIRQDQFEELQKAILTLLESTLGPKAFTPLVKSSFEKALSATVSGIVRAQG